MNNLNKEILLVKDHLQKYYNKVLWWVKISDKQNYAIKKINKCKFS